MSSQSPDSWWVSQSQPGLASILCREDCGPLLAQGAEARCSVEGKIHVGRHWRTTLLGFVWGKEDTVKTQLLKLSQ